MSKSSDQVLFFTTRTGSRACARTRSLCSVRNAFLGIVAWTVFLFAVLIVPRVTRPMEVRVSDRERLFKTLRPITVPASEGSKAGVDYLYDPMWREGPPVEAPPSPPEPEELIELPPDALDGGVGAWGTGAGSALGAWGPGPGIAQGATAGGANPGTPGGPAGGGSERGGAPRGDNADGRGGAGSFFDGPNRRAPGNAPSRRPPARSTSPPTDRDEAEGVPPDLPPDGNTDLRPSSPPPAIHPPPSPPAPPRTTAAPSPVRAPAEARPAPPSIPPPAPLPSPWSAPHAGPAAPSAAASAPADGFLRGSMACAAGAREGSTVCDASWLVLPGALTPFAPPYLRLLLPGASPAELNALPVLFPADDSRRGLTKYHKFPGLRVQGLAQPLSAAGCARVLAAGSASAVVFHSVSPGNAYHMVVNNVLPLFGLLVARGRIDPAGDRAPVLLLQLDARPAVNPALLPLLQALSDHPIEYAQDLRPGAAGAPALCVESAVVGSSVAGSTWLPAKAWLLRRLLARGAQMPPARQPGQPLRLLYISRTPAAATAAAAAAAGASPSPSRGRRILNEASLVARLQQLPGVAVRAVELGALPFAEQLAAAAAADIIVGAHGAGLAWTLFQPLHSALVQVVPFGGGGSELRYLYESLAQLNGNTALSVTVSRPDDVVCLTTPAGAGGAGAAGSPGAGAGEVPCAGSIWMDVYAPIDEVVAAVLEAAKQLRAGVK